VISDLQKHGLDIGQAARRSASIASARQTRIVNGQPKRDIDQLLPWAYREQFLKASPENDAYAWRSLSNEELIISTERDSPDELS
jgi:hypothetical protein